MFQRQKNWISDVLWKPKKPHSLEQLRYLHYVLTKNQMVNETNRGLLVETLRSIAEILIWGDQNDSRVFDFFLEKNMLQFFQKFMNQTTGRFICVQLLQTLSILFENIRNETSLYYLLSNNHVNSIIIHKFDFSDEEILAYYISFIKTLSLKLNRHTIHFFFNERKNDFPLYTEAIKFFNHNDRMVKIAVRTLTLNVYRVGDKAMLNFIRDKTADPYFSNLAWFIGNHAIELNSCVLRDSDHLRCDRLKDLVAEHLDHLHYLNDIFTLNIEDLNSILTEQLSNRLLIPLYIYSLVCEKPGSEKREQPHISTLVSLFLLSQILLILSHPPLMSTLIDIILNGDDMLSEGTPDGSPILLRKTGSKASSVSSIRTFQPPEDTLEQSLVASGVNTEAYSFLGRISLTRERKSLHVANSKFYVKGSKKREGRGDRTDMNDEEVKEHLEEKSSPRTAKLNGVAVPLMDTPLGTGQDSDDEQRPHPPNSPVTPVTPREDSLHQPWKVAKVEQQREHLQKSPEPKSLVKRSVDFECNRMFFSAIQSALDCSDNDEEALFALCLVYATITNKGVDQDLLKMAGISSQKTRVAYNEELVENVIRLMEQGCRNGSKVRTVTLQMAIAVLKELVGCDGGKTSYMCDQHLAFVESVREASTLQLRHYYKDEEIFLDMFEDEYRQMKMKPLDVQRLMTDATLLLPITGTPLTGIEFSKRLPCGEVEHARRAIRVFLMMRELCLTLMSQPETQLPLSKVENSVHQEDVLDLNNSDLIACTVKMEGRLPLRRFLVIDEAQFILVEPDTSKLGWGVVKFVARLQDVETSPDREDSRSLFITIHQPFSANSLTKVRARPIMSAKFVFDDYIRCMSAKQRLQRRRLLLKQHKLHCIAQLLELPALATPPSHYYSITPPAYINLGQQQQSSYVRSPTSTEQGALSHEAPPQSEARPVLEEQNKFSPREDSQPSAHAHVHGHLGPAMAAPEKCLSPSRGTSSQAEALASVLRQSPPPGDGLGRDESSHEAFARSHPQRAVSVEEAVEALELEMQQTEKERNHAVGNNDCVTRDLDMRDRVAKDSISIARNDTGDDCSTPGSCSASSSRPQTRSQSLENLVNCSSGIKRFISLSAPASPRGARHPPPVDPSEYENVARLAAVNSMSEPTLFIEDSLKESIISTSAPPHWNKENNRPKTSRQHKGKNRKR